MRRATGLILLAAALVALALQCLPYRHVARLDPQSVVPWGGHAYAAPVSELLPGGAFARLLDAQGDSNDAPRASRMRLFELGRELGPAHSLHSDIASKGGGKFSHWNGAVVFAATDNSDPRTNGRTYAIEARMNPPWWMAIGLLAAAAMLLRRTSGAAWLARHRRGVFWASAAGLALAVNAAFVLLIPGPIPHPDSSTYLTWSILRTLGYPTLLYSYHFVVQDWMYLPLLQVNLVLAALFLLAHALACVTGRYLAAWLLVSGTLLGAASIVSAADMLTEAPFGALMMAHLALAMLYFRSQRPVTALAAGLALAAAVAIKSVGVVLVGPLALIVAFARGQRRVPLAFMLVPGLIAWALPSAYNYARHGTFETTHAGGFALSGHVAWAIRPAAGSPVETEAALVRQRIAPVLARRPALFGSTLEYVRYTANEYNELLWANMVPELEKHYEGRRVREPCSWDGRERACVVRHALSLNRALLRMSREAIGREPGRYAYHVLAHFYGLWHAIFTPPQGLLAALDDRSASLAAAYDPVKSGFAQLLGKPPLLTGAERVALVQRLEDSAAVRLADLVTLQKPLARLAAGLNPLALLALSILASALIVRFRSLSPELRAFCYCALCINAYLLGTALAQPALSRYAAAVQGPVVAMALLAMHVAWRALSRHVGGGRLGSANSARRAGCRQGRVRALS